MASNIVDSIYKLRQTFLLIGLTGRTGSGCSTIARLLSGSFVDLYAPSPCDYNAPHPNEKRKYSIVYNFLKNNWYSFEVVSASDMLFFFILLEGFDNFIKAISASVKDSTAEKQVELGDELKQKFEKASETAKEINSFLEGRESYKLKDASDKAALKQKIEGYKRFLFEEIHVLRKAIDERVVKETQDTLFQKYQSWGNSIRRYGSISNTSTPTGDPSTLSRKINQVVKMLRDYNDFSETGKKPTYVVIDALRNPYEVLYFRERYSSFYLMSVTTDEKVRKENLHNQQYTKAAIESMDAMENPEKEKDMEPAFYEQDIAKCVGLSDIFISHDGTPEKRNKDLKVQLIRFVSLMLHPGLISPTPQERMMQIAFTAKLNSGCISRQVGAAVSDANFSVKSIGWNTAPQGQVPCTLCNFCNLVSRLDDDAFSDYERNDSGFRATIEKVDAEYKKKGENAINENGIPHTFCFKDLYILHTDKENQVHTRSLHAEENAFLQLAKYGCTGIEGGKLFVTASPCELCSKKSYQLGIKEIYYIDTYPGIAMQHIISSGDKRPRLIHFNGAIGRAYINLYNPLLSMKDEIANLTGINVKKIGKESDKKNSFQKNEKNEEPKV
ncbi:MAG: hypothetical protein K6A98_05335 [Prevotella sp.]|nr:hypothetical protein [Prevotella sp.]